MLFKSSLLLSRFLMLVMFLIGTNVFAHESHLLLKASNRNIEITALVEGYQSDDFRNKKSERHYFATDTATQKRYEIHFDKKAPKHFKAGNVLKLSGKLVGETDLFLNSQDTEAQLAAANGSSSGTGSSPVAAVIGDRKTLVIAIDSNDATVSCSAEQIRNLMFDSPTNSVNHMFREASYSKLSFSGMVYDHVKINVTSAGACDYSGWGNMAEQVLQSRGISTSGYSNKVYVLPPGSGCGWAGLGMLGQSGAWINGNYCNTADVYAHELGHNLNLHHAGTPGSEYGDTSCIMGYGGIGLRTVNSPHKINMGWTPTSHIVNGSLGNFTITSLETNPANTTTPMVVLLPKSDTGGSYYLSLRKRVGYDSILSGTYADRLNIHTASGNLSTFQGSITVGENFTDATNGLTITVNSMDASNISFQVSGQCTRNSPRITLTPSTQGGAAGQTLSYTAQVQNLDSTYCPASTFNLAAAAVAGLTINIANPSLTIAAGATGSATIQVTSAVTTTSGNHMVQISADDAAVANHSAQGSATYVIDGETPSLPANLTSRFSGNKVVLSWSPSTDNVRVQGYQIMKNDDVSTIKSVTTNTYSEVFRKGSVTFKVRAKDDAGNLSAWTAAITVRK